MSTIDVIARLQLRGEQFASEGGKQAAELAAKMRTASQDVRASWTESFAEVRRLSATAFEMPRNAGGSLDLSSEIGQLKQAAIASDERAEAARQMAVAMEAASRAANVDAEALRRDADAASVAALASERDASAIRDRIVALEAVQVELNRSTVATRQLIDTGSRHVVSANQQRQAQMMLGQQFQDFFVQVSSGQRVATAFAQQIGQVGFAVQQMGGRLAGVATFLSSGWGQAAQIGLVVLAPLVSKMFEGEDAADKMASKAMSLADALSSSAYATKEAQKALAEYNAEQDKARKSSEWMLDATLKQTDATLALALAKREELKVRLSNVAGEVNGADPLSTQQRGAQEIYAARLAENEAATRKILQTRRDLLIEIAKRDAPAAGDALKAITDKYARLAAAAEDAASKNTRLAGALRGTLAGYERQKNAELEAERRRQVAANREASRSVRDDRQTGRQIDLAEARRIVASIGGVVSSGLRTIDEQRKLYERYLAGKGPLAAKPGTSDHERGLAVDIPKAAGITLASVRKAFRDQGVQLTQLLDEGKHIHAAFGRRGSSGDVVSARAAELKAETTEAAKLKRANDELERSLDQLARRYDPATAAARDYREAVADIIKLQNAGKLSGGEGFDLIMRSRQTMAQTKGDAFNTSFQDIFGPDAIRSTVEEFNRGIMTGADLAGHRLEMGALNAGEALAGAVGNIANMFGLRIGGAANALFAPGGIQGGARETAKLLGDSLKGVGVEIGPKTLGTLTTALAGAATGQIGGSIFSGITGKKNSAVGSAAGGILGELAGKELGKVVTKEVGGALGKTLGGAAGPIGSLVGGALGGLLGGLFVKAKTGAVSVTGSNVGVIGGNNAGVQQVLSGLGGAVQKGVNRIVDQLGGTLGDYMVSIGKYDDYYRVSSTNTKTVGEKGYSPGRVPGLIYDGTDESAAVEAAIRDAIADGAVKGISEAAKRVLAAGKDLDSALNKALLIESVPRDLKAMLDPVGAAVDDLNRRFQKTVDALKEGGASAEEMARAEQLYNLQLQQVKNSTAAASASLKSFLTDLKLGGNSPYSLREQEATALAQLKPYLDQIGAGQRVDQDKYQQAARAYLDVERQLYGSTQAYFDAQAQIQAATAKAIETIDNAVPITPGVESPFAKATADSAAKTASNTQTGNELLSQLSDQMESVRQLLAQMQGGGASGFIGDVRAFG
ncbi:MAG: hypothetical protein VYB32_01555 [Pseudomonadota bacterium]|nr:hypothetical protein [Pseudomonadota bacterium]